MFHIFEKSTGKIVGCIHALTAEQALSMWVWLWKEDSSKFEAK